METAVVDATCQGCGATFEASRSDAKWCKDRCRKAAKRDEVPSVHDSPGDRHELVLSTQRALAAAGALDTFSGQLALQLARRIVNPDESGVSSLSKELRTVMAAALAHEAPPSANDELEDEVEKARRARDAKARKAAG
jgi:hypothetical protein